MLRAVLHDLRAWGRFPVVTTLDRRLRGTSLPADRVVVLDTEVYPTGLADLAKLCGAALLIAPESEGILERVSALVRDAGACLLGSRPEGVAVAADKWECYQRFVRAGLPTPETVCTTPAGAVQTAEELGFPLVVKPVTGAGCDGVAFVPRVHLLQTALQLPALRHAEHLLLQRFVAGTPASVSLLVAGKDSLALSLNEQWVQAGIPFTYRGGVACTSRHRSAQAFQLAKRAVALVPGLQGYVGVDLVLGHQGCRLLEINPRLTTSYVGLHRVININLAEAIWRACREGALPECVSAAGEAAFGKEELGGL